jgi:hypothetical protein
MRIGSASGPAAALGVAVVGTAVGLGLVAVRISTGAIGPDEVGGALFPPLGALPFAVVGTYILLRRPANTIGRLMLLIGTMMGIAYPADVYARLDAGEGGSLPAAGVAAWLSGNVWIVVITIVIPRMLLLFPDGRLASPRWRVVGVVQAVLVATIVLVAFAPGPLPDYAYENPFGVEALGGVSAVVEANQSIVFGLMFVVLVAACVSLIARFRRSTGVEHRQLKWIAWIVLVVGLAWTLGIIIQPFWRDVGSAVTGVAIIALIALPVAIGMAVLRYRLYEIDRIISRTIGWALVTGILGAVFASAVVGLQAALAGVTQGQTLAVAASTLVAFALFAPMRRRVQSAVDRQFDRARYDGERVVAAFGERLRDRADLAAVETDIAATVAEALRPGSATLWVRREIHS